jgi:hypothetical protein
VTEPGRRTRRVVPALTGAVAITAALALAAGPIAGDIAPQRAAAAAGIGPSEQACASAFDNAANAGARRAVPRAHVLRVQVFATPIPSCVIEFQLPDERVLTVQAPWAHDTATGFRSSIHHPGLVAGPNAVWRDGRLTVARSRRPLLLGPPPTPLSCLDAWNASPPALHVTGGAAVPALVQAFNGGVVIVGSNGSKQPSISGFACAVWAALPAGRATYVVGGWQPQGTVRWHTPERMSGMLGGLLPNADLGTDGRLRPRLAPVPKPVPTRTRVPRVAHQIGASGWAGGFRLYQTLAQAIRRFGRPTDTIPNGFGCEVTWPALQLAATFEFGTVRKGGLPIPCGTTSRAISLTATGTWSTTRGLAVGAPDNEISRRYPGATSVTSLAEGTTTWYLAPRHGSARGQGLTAETRSGVVTGLTITAGSTTFGADIVPSTTP